MLFQNMPYESDSPKVVYFDNVLTFSGKSIPSDADMVWFPIIQDLTKLSVTDLPLIVNFQFDYYNTASARYLTTVFKILDTMHARNKNVIINWFYYDIDETMKELGEMFAEMIKCKVNFKKLRYE